MINPLFSRSRDDWQTPEIVLQRVRRVNKISLDPCTTPTNPTKAEMWASTCEIDFSAKDGLQIPWSSMVENLRPAPTP